ncbi:MAG: DUF1176 domain-containing protein [Hyphomicrobiales bacterium]|nr:DUF1176 domain-containing protein [Hyphomicrobiales bacterium]
MVTRNIAFLALLSMLLCDDVGLAARAESHRHQEPRTAIAWPDGCAYYPIDDAAPNAHGLERECAAALSSITDWPKSPEECDYDYGKDFFLGPARVPSPRFLPLSPGKFLIEMDCGGGAYNPLKAYLFYRETKSLTAGKLLRFPYYPFGSSSAPEHVPPLIWKTVISARAFNRRRGELNVFAKFRGLGDCGTFARYVFPGDEPVLREFRVKTACDNRFPYAVRGHDPRSPKGWRKIGE